MKNLFNRLFSRTVLLRVNVHSKDKDPYTLSFHGLMWDIREQIHNKIQDESEDCAIRGDDVEFETTVL